jgi:hypothetical protein
MQLAGLRNAPAAQVNIFANVLRAELHGAAHNTTNSIDPNRELNLRSRFLRRH